MSQLQRGTGCCDSPQELLKTPGLDVKPTSPKHLAVRGTSSRCQENNERKRLCSCKALCAAELAQRHPTPAGSGGAQLGLCRAQHICFPAFPFPFQVFLDKSIHFMHSAFSPWRTRFPHVPRVYPNPCAWWEGRKMEHFPPCPSRQAAGRARAPLPGAQSSHRAGGSSGPSRHPGSAPGFVQWLRHGQSRESVGDGV